MRTSFSGSLGDHRASAFAGAMQAMGDTTWKPPDTSSGLDARQRAVNKASAWTDRAAAAASGMADHMNSMAADTANAGMQIVTSDVRHQAEMDAARAAMAAQKKSGIAGLVSQGLGIGLSLLCERRLKQDIRPLDQNQAWSLVRDLPLYSFSYKAAPGRTVYGPMIDEVEPLDPSLVRPTLLGSDEQGPLRGFDVMRHQAYESIALQQALQRIEALEAQVSALQARTAPFAQPAVPFVRSAPSAVFIAA